MYSICAHIFFFFANANIANAQCKNTKYVMLINHIADIALLKIDYVVHKDCNTDAASVIRRGKLDNKTFTR